MEEEREWRKEETEKGRKIKKNRKEKEGRSQDNMLGEHEDRRIESQVQKQILFVI
jgi:hypothetical protein